MAECLFCKIVEGAIPSTKVAETQLSLAFRDIHPAAPTHVLLIPKEHVAASAAEITRRHGAALADLFELAGAVARSEGLGEGWRLVTNVGAGAGQSVLHLHFHLLGGRALAWPPG